MSENQNVEKTDYAKTLNLPKTSFKMKANLAQKEPLTLRDWTKSNIYEKSLKEGHPFFILHDGPPYANGDIHIAVSYTHLEMKDSGVIVVCLLAISGDGKPYYDSQMSGKIASLGIPCFACNHEKLPLLLERVLKNMDLSSFEKEFSKKK